MHAREIIVRIRSQVEPKWKMDEQFIYIGIQSVFLMDSLKSTHPISVRVSRPEEINELFDRISYDKGDLTRFSFVRATIILLLFFFLTSVFLFRGVCNSNDGSFSHASGVSKRLNEIFEFEVRYVYCILALYIICVFINYVRATINTNSKLVFFTTCDICGFFCLKPETNIINFANDLSNAFV